MTTNNPVLVTDSEGMPVAFIDLDEINTRADTLTKAIVTAACINSDTEEAGEHILTHLAGLGGEDRSAAAVALATLRNLATVLDTLADEIRTTTHPEATS